MKGSGSSVAYTIGPGAPTPAVKLLLIATIGIFLAQYFADLVPFGEYGNLNGAIIWWFGMTPALVVRGYVWQPLSYMFLHGGFMHLIFNMLAVWMFGVDLERRWGQTAFYRYYFVCGVGAALTTLVVGLLPFASTQAVYVIPTIGASGSVYGLLLAYAIFFPNRIIYYFIFPIPVRVYVLLTGLLVLYESARGGAGGGVAHFAHLGGLLFGYLYLSMGRGGPWAEIKYRYVKWRMNRLKKRFDVHDGGRRWDSRVH
ncbi:MAG: rhomboid family intramembrane serine protease [Vicinamibacteraceae bacterium]